MTTTKFKVGDRVRVTDASLTINEEYYRDEIGTVCKDDGTDVQPYLVRFDKALADGYASTQYFDATELTAVTGEASKPTLATAVGLEPQTRRILGHLEKKGTISPMEALVNYGCFRLAAQVFKLRRAGFDVKTTLHADENGHQYARYSLAKDSELLAA